MTNWRVFRRGWPGRRGTLLTVLVGVELLWLAAIVLAVLWLVQRA